MRERAVSSSVATDDWLPVLQQLTEGFSHALGNRVAALGGISQLLELGLASRDEGGLAVAKEVKLLRDLLELLRSLGSTKQARREAGRAGDGLRAAAQLLLHHRDARENSYEIAAEPADVEPLLLWRGDHVRAGVLFLLAASGRAAEQATTEINVRVHFEARDGTVRIVATTSVAAEVVGNATAFAALGRFADAERGECTCAAAPGGATALTLALPGLARATAQQGVKQGASRDELPEKP